MVKNTQPQCRIPQSFVKSFFGICHPGYFHLYPSLGAEWCRVDFPWKNIEPIEGRMLFQRFDEIVEEASKYGVKIFPILDYCPLWASSGPDMNYPPKEASWWMNYVERTVSRYLMRYGVKYFEIWNEPNIEEFWKADYKSYVDDVLIPAARLIHRHEAYVVAPSVTLEHWDWNTETCIERMDKWLSYHDAWKYIDIISFHYSKGDTAEEKGENTSNLMEFYDYLYEKWIASGRIMGLWNTEEGMTAVYGPNHEMLSLEAWEKPPHSQWVPRYLIPVLHWAIRHDWNFRDKYKVFWYHIADSSPETPLCKTNIIGASGELTEVGMALKTLTNVVFNGDVGVYEGEVHVGSGENEFTSYSFRVNDEVFVAAWIDRPERTVKLELCGLRGGGGLSIYRIDYPSGERERVEEWTVGDDGRLQAYIPTSNQPIIYVKIQGA